MFIRALKFRNFKNFKTEQTVEFGEKNIIVGKNGSGKSTLLSALRFIFFNDGIGNLANGNFINDDDEESIISLDINNSEHRFPCPDYFTIKVIIKQSAESMKHSLEYFINEKSINLGELRGIIENAGLHQENFVAQGKITEIGQMSSSERYEFIAKIAGIKKYEESKECALEYLETDNEEKLLKLMENIEIRSKKNELLKKRLNSYEELKKKKIMLEFELKKWEINDLNRSIDELSGCCSDKDKLDKQMVEFELKDCREQSCIAQNKLSMIEQRLGRYDKRLVESLNQNCKDNDNQNCKESDNQNTDNQYSQNTSNPYRSGYEQLKRKLETLLQQENDLKNRERATFIELNALKYYEAMGNKQEDLDVLRERRARKEDEIQRASKGEIEKINTNNMVEERKQLWIKEKRMNEELANLTSCKERSYKKALYMGKQSINIYEMIKDEEGVIGTVYSLMNVPDEILDAYESVTKSSLFWIVVENEDVATRLMPKIDGRATFLALNRLRDSSGQYGDNNNDDTSDGDRCSREDRLIKLASVVKCDRKYQIVADFICKDYYLCTDIKTAVEMKEKYSVNTVTMEGDIVSKSGAITGGYEPPMSVLREIKKNEMKIKRLKNELEALKKQIANLDEELRLREYYTDDNREGDRIGNSTVNNTGNSLGERHLENLESIKLYLDWKIAIKSNKKVKLRNSDDVVREYKLIGERFPELKLEIEELRIALEKQEGRKQKIDDLVSYLAEKRELEKTLRDFREKEKGLVDILYGREEENVEENANLQKKCVLVEKRTKIMESVGLRNFKNLEVKGNRESLISEFKNVQNELQKYTGYENLNSFENQNLLETKDDEMRERMRGLIESKEKIKEFIKMVDRRKEETVNLTFSMISENYESYFHFLTGGKSTLKLEGNEVKILLDGNEVSIFLLSGGQKTVVAVCLILAVHKNDPSPFYIFDEIDANLDVEHCKRVYELIRRSRGQYFITSFRENSLSCGDRYYGVVMKDRKSYVGEIERGLALETIQL